MILTMTSTFSSNLVVVKEEDLYFEYHANELDY